MAVPALAASVGIVLVPVALFPPVSVAVVMVVVPVTPAPVMTFEVEFVISNKTQRRR